MTKPCCRKSGNYRRGVFSSVRSPDRMRIDPVILDVAHRGKLVELGIIRGIVVTWARSGASQVENANPVRLERGTKPTALLKTR